MTQQSDALAWRVLVKHATTYTHYLSIDDDQARQRLEQFYHVQNLAAWAKEHIEALLEQASNLWLEFEDNEELADQTRQAASTSLDKLKEAGYDAFAEDDTEWMF